ncbi:MAG: class I SAM-dependent methyltransferase [Bacteroidales bacterium]|nr:class I SAM-dependent methyltransferase [Bacteroidales bacterium]
MKQQQTSSYYSEVESYYNEDATLGFESRAGGNRSLERIRNDFREITIRYPFTSALEIGCGPGFDVHWFAGKFPERQFTAVDISASMTALAKARIERDKLTNASVVRSDERHLVELFGEGSFDLVYVYFGALNTVESLDVAAAEIRKLMKPGGIAVVTFVNKWYLRELLVQTAKFNFYTAFARLGKVWGGYSVTRHLPSHCYSPARIKKAFNNFSLLERKGYSIFYPPWYNDHKIKNNPEKAERLWKIDQKLQKTFLWATGEYTLFVYRA